MKSKKTLDTSQAPSLKQGCYSMKAIASILLLMMVCLSIPLQAVRKALVIGNADYAYNPLRNPVNDANLVADKLTQLGFEVTKVTNANQSTMDKALKSFADLLTSRDEAVFFYSGGGAAVDGISYLTPVDKLINNVDDLRHNALDTNRVLELLQRARVSVMVLDACRDNPYSKKSSGLSSMINIKAKAGNQYVIFSTEYGKTTSDGKGSNSPFTESFVKYLDQPLVIENMARLVIRDVESRTNSKQTPCAIGSLVDEFYFSPAQGKSPKPRTTIPPMNKESCLITADSANYQFFFEGAVLEEYDYNEWAELRWHETESALRKYILADADSLIRAWLPSKNTEESTRSDLAHFVLAAMRDSLDLQFQSARKDFIQDSGVAEEQSAQRVKTVVNMKPVRALFKLFYEVEAPSTETKGTSASEQVVMKVDRMYVNRLLCSIIDGFHTQLSQIKDSKAYHDFAQSAKGEPEKP